MIYQQTACDMCIHRDVCGYSSDFDAAIENLKRSSYPMKSAQHTGNSVPPSVYYEKCDLVAVSVGCNHYLPEYPETPTPLCDPHKTADGRSND